MINKDTMALAFHEVCLVLRLSTPRVCVGLIEQMKDTIHFIRQNSRLKATEVCGVLLGSQCFIGRSDHLFWKLDIPAVHHNSRSKHKQSDRTYQLNNANTRQILHLADIHLDLEYETGSHIECNEPICCRTLPSLDTSLTSNNISAGIWGSYPCDLPLNTLKNAMKDISRNSHKVDLWYWTGDIVAHDIWQYSRQRNIVHSQIITQLIQQYSNGSRIVPVIGNHEAVPINCFPPPSIQNSHSISWLYEALAQQWSQWLPLDVLQLVRYAGYYTLVINKGFRVIVLNTNYCARLNLWTYYNAVDPADQLKWLIKELVNAEEDGDYVHIVGHVPVDNRECTQAWVYNYLSIIERFSHIIKAQFFGHTHADEFRVLYSNHNITKPIGFEILSPSLTTFQTFNPSYRIITANYNGEIKDMDTFFFNLTQANQLGEGGVQNSPVWYYEYSMRRQYSLNNFNAQDFHLLINQLVDTQSSSKQDQFYSHYYRYSDSLKGNYCNEDCRHKIINDIIINNPYEKLPKSILERG